MKARANKENTMTDFENFMNIEEYPTHIAGLPVAVNINCHVTRHKTEVL